MGNLGDFFSREIKEKLADNSIVNGSVIRCYSNATNPPKEKRFVILGRDLTGNFVGTVFINSTVNFKVINSQELLELQYFVKKDNDNKYLDWDSFIDCSKLIKFEYEYVKSSIVDRPACILGSVKDEDLEIIYKLVKSSPNNSPIELKNMGLL
jgi:uncharacterized protein YfkK (UPF0435 family)